MAGKAKNLIGERFGRLTVVSQAGRYKSDRHTQWTCQCLCGNTMTVPTNSLTMGRTTSCGCYRQESVYATVGARLAAIRKQNATKYHFLGEERTLAEWETELGIPYRTLLYRMNRQLKGHFQRVL